MKLDFEDTIKKDEIDLTFEIKGDTSERSIYPEKADIKWALKFNNESWGLDKFSYELIEMRMPITIDTVMENDEIETTTVYAEVRFNSKHNKRGYFCRIYEDVNKNGKWEESDYATFPIILSVEESPTTDNGDRAQIYIKFIEIDLNADEKKMSITI